MACCEEATAIYNDGESGSTTGSNDVKSVKVQDIEITFKDGAKTDNTMPASAEVARLLAKYMNKGSLLMVKIRTPAAVRGGNAARLAKKYNSGGHLTAGIHKKDNKEYPTGDIATAEAGALQEFGYRAPNGKFISPQVWLRVFSLYNEHKKNLGDYASACFRDCRNLRDAWQEIGLFTAETVKDRIRDDQVTPHGEKDGTTLIDKGLLINSIDFEVNE